MATVHIMLQFAVVPAMIPLLSSHSQSMSRNQRYLRPSTDSHCDSFPRTPIHHDYLTLPLPTTNHPTMPKVAIDVAFGRESEHPVMYVLRPDKTHSALFDENLILTISDRAPRRLGGDGWSNDQQAGDINRGWLYHGILKTYPRLGHARARDHADEWSVSSPSTPSSASFNVGSVPLPETEVAVKWVRGTRAIESLRREARMYDRVLGPVQGSAVPIFYGLFVNRQDGVDVGCLLLEWCPGNDPVAVGKPTEDVL